MHMHLHKRGEHGGALAAARVRVAPRRLRGDLTACHGWRRRRRRPPKPPRPTAKSHRHVPPPRPDHTVAVAASKDKNLGATFPRLKQALHECDHPMGPVLAL